MENKFQQLKDQYDVLSNGTQKEEVSSSSLIINRDDGENFTSFHSHTTIEENVSPCATRTTADGKFCYELQTRHISVDNANEIDNESVDKETDVEGQFLTAGDSPMVSARTTSTHYNSNPGLNDEPASGKDNDSIKSLQNNNNVANPPHRTTAVSTPEFARHKSCADHVVDGSSVSLRNSVRFSSRSSSRRSSRASCRSHRGLAPLRKEPSEDEKVRHSNTISTVFYFNLQKGIKRQCACAMAITL